MLTCLASESTSLTFLTFPPQLLRMGERAARLWFCCTWPPRQLLLPQPHGAGKHPRPPAGHHSATNLQGLTHRGSAGQGQAGDRGQSRYGHWGLSAAQEPHETGALKKHTE